MKNSDQKSWTDLACPSNLIMAALVGFLLVGQATDWKVISRRPAKVNATTRFGTPEIPAAYGRIALLRGGLPQQIRVEPAEQIVDRGSATANRSRMPDDLD